MERNKRGLKLIMNTETNKFSSNSFLFIKKIKIIHGHNSAGMFWIFFDYLQLRFGCVCVFTQQSRYCKQKHRNRREREKTGKLTSPQKRQYKQRDKDQPNWLNLLTLTMHIEQSTGANLPNSIIFSMNNKHKHKH